MSSSRYTKNSASASADAPPFAFTPDIALDPARVPASFSIKGARPRLTYPFRLCDIYPGVPSLGVLDAYERIRSEFDGIDLLLSARFGLRPNFRLPRLQGHSEAAALLGVLYDPCQPGFELPPFSEARQGRPIEQRLLLRRPRPFPLERASQAKLVHTLAWIDTNIKVAAERFGLAVRLPDYAVRQLVSAALSVYCLLVKMSDYHLARNMSFNHSMFLQDRTLSLLLGPALSSRAGLPGSTTDTGRLANRMALELLLGLGDLTLRQMCALSLFMGVVWTSTDDVQEAYRRAPESLLAQLEGRLDESTGSLCIDDVDRFLRAVGEDKEMSIAVVLDDNGESAFDLALFQRILLETPRVGLSFVVNRYPVSNNLCLDSFESLLRHPYFSGLSKELRRGGRASLHVEQQLFRSFDDQHLTTGCRRLLASADMAYVKGVNFYETFQPMGIDRYYCFVVTGHTSAMLTGCPEGSAVFAHVPRGRAGYLYEDSNHVRTLRSIAREEDMRK